MKKFNNGKIYLTKSHWTTFPKLQRRLKRANQITKILLDRLRRNNYHIPKDIYLKVTGNGRGGYNRVTLNVSPSQSQRPRQFTLEMLHELAHAQFKQRDYKHSGGNMVAHNKRFYRTFYRMAIRCRVDIPEYYRDYKRERIYREKIYKPLEKHIKEKSLETPAENCPGSTFSD